MSTPALDVARHVAEVRDAVGRWRSEGHRIAFVPTMGNLHAGHRSLLELAARLGDRFVASIFVNPMQFGPNEDFAHYPRTPDADASMLAEAGCDLMFIPDVAEMYPNGPENATRIEVPELSGILCGEFRPGHFQGVATVVAKLFNIVDPDTAIFGMKDYQQLTVIRRMVADLCMPVQIVGAPTVRESDGLAMSSRNQYLTADERALAPGIHHELQRAAARLLRGDSIDQVQSDGAAALADHGFSVEYFAVRRALDLMPASASDHELAVLTAARLGKARLIDNVEVRR
ncbi:MAG: pantoate--beta-alanine ligase [Steroidobacteraceae bacterium]